MTEVIKTFDTDDRLSDWWISIESANAGTTIVNWTWRANIVDWFQTIGKTWVTIWNWDYLESKWYYWWQAGWWSNRIIWWLLATNTRWQNSIKIQTQNSKYWWIYNVWVYKVEWSTETKLASVTYATMWVSITDSIRICMEHKWDKIEFRVYKSSDNSLLWSYDCTDSWVLSQSFSVVQAKCHTTTDNYNYTEEIVARYDSVAPSTFTPKVIMF